MSKKKNKNKERTPVTPEKKELSLAEQQLLIDKYLKKYQRFSFLTESFLEQLLQSVDLYASSLDVSFALDKAINLSICDVIRQGDMDAMIALEDQYWLPFTLVLRKFGVKEKDFKAMIEDILLEVIEKYDGTDAFNIYFTKVARNYINEKEKTSFFMQTKRELKKLPAKDNIDDMLFIGNRLGILHNIPLDDPIFVKFVIYHYGYDGFYATDEAIKKELNLSDDEYNNYLKRSYQIISNSLKDTLGELTSNKGVQKKKENIPK